MIILFDRGAEAPTEHTAEQVTDKATAAPATTTPATTTPRSPSPQREERGPPSTST